jgi:hypothetical protein
VSRQLGSHKILGICYWAIRTLAAMAMVDPPGKKGLKPYGWQDKVAVEQENDVEFHDWPTKAAMKTKIFLLIILIIGLPYLIHLDPFCPSAKGKRKITTRKILHA